MTTEVERRRTCSGIRKDGQRCESRAVAADGRCFVHRSSPDEIVEAARRAGIASGESRRELAKSVRERLRDKVEANAEAVWAAYFDSLNATTPDGQPDYRARYQAASALLAEAYGKPVQPTEEQGRGPVIVVRAPLRESPPEESSAELPANVRRLPASDR